MNLEDHTQATEPARSKITVLPPASWAEGAADLLERALYLRSMSTDDATPVEQAITEHLNRSMRSAGPAPGGELIALIDRNEEVRPRKGTLGRDDYGPLPTGLPD